MITDKDYTNPYGTWEVTTEGDCEGRSTRSLGVYVGNLDDIAFALAEKCFYSLEFTKINTEIPTPTKALDEVTVSLNIASNTWKMSAEDRIKYFENMFSNRDVYVSSSSIYASVTLNKTNTEKTKREVALAKLTNEEKRLLGLE